MKYKKYKQLVFYLLNIFIIKYNAFLLYFLLFTFKYFNFG